MKKQKIGLLRIIWLVQVMAEVITAVLVWHLDMLPAKFLIPLLVVLALAAVLTGVMMCRKHGKWERGVRKGGRIVGCVLSIAMIAICAVASHAVYTVTHTIGTITNNQVSSVVSVYVLADDPAQNIQDAEDYCFATVTSFDQEAVEKAVSNIEKDLDTTLNRKDYNTAFEMIDALYAKQIGAIIMSESYLDILDSTEEYSDFSEKVRLLDTHIVEKPKQDEDKTEQILPTVEDPTSDSFLLYISGNDARRELLADGGSDVNILVAVNPTAKQILMVNTPRDYFVANPAGNGAKDKLTLCGMYGIENSVEAISQLYGQPISYYAKINFTGFKTLVDAVGGVTVYVEKGFNTTSDTYVKTGENHFNGTEALAFARERKHLPGGDNDRGKNQMKIITALINQLTSGTALANYTQILGSLEGMFATNMPLDTISDLVKMQLNDMASWDILTYAVTGDNGKDQPYSQGGLYAYVMYPHQEEVDKAAGLIARVLDGEVLSEADLAD